MIKIVKNTTNADIFLPQPGATVQALSSYTIDPQNYGLWVQSMDSYIDSGAIIINDGTSDLNNILGKDLINTFLAKDLGFNNSANGFSSNNIQGAIEEIANKSSIPEYNIDPVSPLTNTSWVLHSAQIGSPIGLLLALTYAVNKYEFSYKTKSGEIVRTDLK